MLGQPSPTMQDLPSSSDHEELFKTVAKSKASMTKDKHLCKACFHSAMGGRDLRVPFSMTVGLPSTTANLLQHDEPPFITSKKCHKEIKPDLGALQQEAVRQHLANVIVKK